MEIIFQFSDLHSFLRDYHANKKLENSGWSYQVWANKIKQNKASLIRTVKGSRELSSSMENALVRYFKFSSDQEKYFRLLVSASRVNSLYPDLNLRVPPLEALRVKKQKFNFIGPENSDAPFLSKIEVQWLVVLYANALLTCQPEKVRAAMHPGLKGVDVEGILLELEDRGLLKVKGQLATFPNPETLFLSGKSVSMADVVSRYQSILLHISNMIQKDFNEGRKPEVNNRACLIKIKKESFPTIMEEMGSALQKVMAVHGDTAGDLLLDLQVFFSPIAKLD